MSRAQTNPREAAWRALIDYDARHPPWEGLQRRCLKGLEGADRALAAEMLTGCLRHRRLLDALLERDSDRFEAAFEGLYTKYRDRVYSIAYRITPLSTSPSSSRESTRARRRASSTPRFAISSG